MPLISRDARASLVDGSSVAMLVQGAEVYGVGSIVKLYAEHWPELTFVCFERGPLHDWLTARGAKVVLVPGVARVFENSSLATLTQLPGLFIRAWRDARRIHAELRTRGIRIVHAHWRPQQIMAGYLRRFGYRSVWQINNTTSDTRLWGLGRRLNHRLARWGADLLLPASDYIARNWRGSGVPMRTIHNAANPLYDQPTQLPEDGPIRCVVAGRLESSKGHHVALEAVAAARGKGCDIVLEIFGGPLEDNPYADDLRRRIAELQMGEVIRLLGFDHNIRRRHPGFHLALQCRIDPEPCSLWVCEALVDGVPVLASESGGTPELIEDGQSGFLYPPGSAASLESLLCQLWNDRTALTRMRRAAFERGQRHFTVTRFLTETRAAYDTLS